MIDYNHEIEEFNYCAGANYSITAIIAMDKHYSSILNSSQSPLIYWLLVSESIAIEDAESTIDWLEYQVNQVYLLSKGLAERLRQGLCSSWSAWLPILIFSPNQDREKIWNAYSQKFPAATSEDSGIRKVLFHLLSEQGRELYEPSNLPKEYQERYREALPCITVKLGLLLRDLEKQETSDQEMFKAWATSLQSVLPRLPNHIKRGFAPSFPLFENLVLSLLYTSEWRTQPEIWRIPEYIDSYSQSPQEKLTIDQISLCAVLFGWLEGYKKVGSFISNKSLRAALSQQAMVIAQRRILEKPLDFSTDDPIIFYFNDKLDRQLIYKNFFQITEINHTENRQKKIYWSDDKNIITEVKEWTEVTEKIEFRLSRCQNNYIHP